MMAETPHSDDYAARSMKARPRDGRAWDGQRHRAPGPDMQGYSGDPSLQRALTTVLRAFPTLFHDLCDNCQNVLESRLTGFAEGETSDHSARSASNLPSSRSASYEEGFRASNRGRGPAISSGNTRYPSDNRKEPYTRSGDEGSYDQSASNGGSYSSAFANGKSSGKDSEANSWGNTRKLLDYNENGKEQIKEPSYHVKPAPWPALSRNGHQLHNIQERLHYEENGKEQNGEPSNHVKPAAWSHASRNNQQLRGIQETVTPYKNAVTNLSNSTLSAAAVTPDSNSKNSTSSVTVRKSQSNNSVAAPRSSGSASLTEFEEEKSNGSRNMKEENKAVEQREWMRFQEVVAKKDFVCLERIKGRLVNVAEGLELHTGILNVPEQERLVAFALELQNRGRNNELMDRTYSEPRKWMRGKGRVTIQFGCCYNYAVDKAGNPPGIVRDETVDPLPKLLKATIKRLVRWHVLPPSCVPDSCIINIYDEGDCIPPHIDHHDFVRPFCTLSLLSECNIVFGSNLKIIGPGEFEGSLTVPLPVGSVLVLKGKGADVAKHAVPAVPTKRISITFRKMDPDKIPLGFVPEKDLQDLTPL
ncbi:hypothetical protein O6H91_11G106200 [Diphasiastrum complanatum]|uniref:Uncharacterized protein n=1 Tax=Diphasiastrum complanatum TaxID=34168 RepID=A0ACC2CCF3_DIPCM|nr:hypothetical protein O6H91_11G106200 [Diphasiastrum complanatum]